MMTIQEPHQIEEPTDALTAWLNAAFTVQPFGLSIADTRQVLGGKSLSGIYEAAAEGKLQFVKDGNKTLVTLQSIKNYIASMPAAKIAMPPPRPEKQRRLKDLAERKTKSTMRGRAS